MAKQEKRRSAGKKARKKDAALRRAPSCEHPPVDLDRAALRRPLLAARPGLERARPGQAHDEVDLAQAARVADLSPSTLFALVEAAVASALERAPRR